MSEYQHRLYERALANLQEQRQFNPSAQLQTLQVASIGSLPSVTALQKPKQTPTMKTSEPSVLAQVANLSNLSLKELNDMWLRLYGVPAPAGQKRPFLQNHLAYRIQELAFAQVNPTLIASNKAWIENILEHLKPLAKNRSKKEGGNPPILRGSQK